MKKGLPAVTTFADPKKPLEFDNFDEEDAYNEQAASEMQVDASADASEEGQGQAPIQKQGPNGTDELLWQWKVRVIMLDSALALMRMGCVAGVGNNSSDFLLVISTGSTHRYVQYHYYRHSNTLYCIVPGVCAQFVLAIGRANVATIYVRCVICF